MKSNVKICGSFLMYHGRDFFCHLLYGSIHCVIILLSNMKADFEISYFAFIMYYGYFPCAQWFFINNKTDGYVSIAHFKDFNTFVFYFSLITAVFINYIIFGRVLAVRLTLPRMHRTCMAKLKQLLHFWEIKMSKKLIQIKKRNYKNKLQKIKDLPNQIISTITSFIEDQGIQNKLHTKTFFNDTDTKFHLGCKMNLSTWEVVGIRQYYQAQDLRVKVGWKLKEAKGKNIILKHKEIREGWLTSQCPGEIEIIFEEPFTHPMREPLEFITTVLFRIVLSLLIKIMHDVLFFILFRKLIFSAIYVVNPHWEPVMMMILP